MVRGGAWGGGAQDGGTTRPAFRSRRRHKTRHADIDVAHFLEQLRALQHRRPSAALHERVINRFRRREGIGLVQEAANGDTGHRFCLSQLFVRVTLDSSLRGAQATKQSSLAWLRAISGLLYDVAPAASATRRKVAKSHPRPGSTT